MTKQSSSYFDGVFHECAFLKKGMHGTFFKSFSQMADSFPRRNTIKRWMTHAKFHQYWSRRRKEVYCLDRKLVQKVCLHYSNLKWFPIETMKRSLGKKNKALDEFLGQDRRSRRSLGLMTWWEHLMAHSTIISDTKECSSLFNLFRFVA